jgi:3-oxoacyl-[acyl-carrier protein] reductase
MLQDKIAIITGAARGIGFACARRFASQGAKIILTSRNNEELLNERVSEINDIYPDSACGFLADAGDYEEVKKLYSFVLSKYKGLDILVNNAGIMETSLLGMMNIEKASSD